MMNAARFFADAFSGHARRPRALGTLLAGMLLTLGLAVAGAPPAGAQPTQGSGSIYSRFGLGTLDAFSSSQAQAMGEGGGLALRSLNYASFANPALWSDQELTRLNIGARYRRVNARNAGGQTSGLSSGALQSAQFSFPLYSGKLGVGVGFRPYSRTEYRVQSPFRPVPSGESPAESARYRIDYRGEGGLRQISGGLGYRIGDALALGLRTDVIFGILESQRHTGFSNRARFSPTTLSTQTRLAGVTGTAGALLSLDEVLRPNDALSVGATFTLPTRLSGERTRTLGSSLARDSLLLGDDETRAENGEITVPLSAGIGLSYKPSAPWTLIAEGRYEPWSGAESDFDFARLPGMGALRDRARLSVGAELLPAGDNRNATFFRRTAYRLGGYYEQTYVGAGVFPAVGLEAEGTDVDVLAATGGISLPTPLYGTRIDVGFKVGTRGTTDAGLVRDVFYGLSLNVNIGERWFQRRKLR